MPGRARREERWGTRGGDCGERIEVHSVDVLRQSYLPATIGMVLPAKVISASRILH